MTSVRFLPFFASLAFVLAALPAPAQKAPTAHHPATKAQLAILDTDIGDDIDDAFALALVLHSPELKLLGVTTAYGDTETRARLLDRYLAAVGRLDIPVAAGVSTPHDNPLSQEAYTRQAPKLKHADGVRFLLTQIRAHPGEITLIGIGPLFNVQAAIASDPATFRKLKRVVIMGGSVYRGYDDGKTGTRRPPDAEWNIKCDPAGLKALLAAGVPVFMMPLDSTQIHLETKEREEIFSHGSPLTDQLTLLYHQWMGASGGHSTTPTLFDPVAVAYAVRPELCPTKPMRIEVDDKGFTHPVEVGASAGSAVPASSDATPNAQVCLQSDEKGFLDFFLSRVTKDSAH